MKPEKRLQGAIDGLHSIVKRYKKQRVFKISNEEVIISNNSSQLWGTVFYLAVSIVLPAGLLIDYLLKDKNNPLILLLLVAVFLFSYYLYKMARGNTIMRIDFFKRIIVAENNNAVFKSLFKTKIISFDEMTHVELKETFIPGRSNSVWLQLIVTLKGGRKVILVDFSNNFPESLIASKVKFLVEVIIWSKKNKSPV